VAHYRRIQCPNLNWRKRCNPTVKLSKRRAQSTAVTLCRDAVLDALAQAPSPALPRAVAGVTGLQPKAAIAAGTPQKNNNPVN
jgi:hypothetical protein